MNHLYKKETLRKILNNKPKLEKKLKVKIEIKSNSLDLEGEEVGIYTATQVFNALDRNFSFELALLLAEPDYYLEDIPIKDVTRKTNLREVKARIIGREGRTLQLISELSNCYVTLHENTVSIIGTFEKMRTAINAVKSLILGSKQASVYAYLEKARKKLFPEKIEFKNLRNK